MDESAEVAGGNAVVAVAEKKNATFLLAQDDVRHRTVAEIAVIQIFTESHSRKRNHQRQRTAGGCDSATLVVRADLLSKPDTNRALKNSSGCGFVANLQRKIVFRQDTTADVVTTAAALWHVSSDHLQPATKCSHAPLSRVFEKASAHAHATCAVFVLPHTVLACPAGKRDDASGVWWITV